MVSEPVVVQQGRQIIHIICFNPKIGVCLVVGFYHTGKWTKESSDNVWQQDGKQRREKLSLWVSHERISTMSRTNVTITGKKFHSAVQHLPQWPQGLSRLEINCSWSSISDNWINRLRSSHRKPPPKKKPKTKTYSMVKMWSVLSYKT